MNQLGEENAEGNENVRQFLDVFNFATLPFYWGSFEPAEGKPRTAELLQAAKFLKKHGVQAYEELIEKCLNAGVKIDAIGLQSHQQGTVTTDEKDWQKLRALRVNITGTSVKAKGFYVVFQGKGKLWHENSCLGKFVVEYSFVDCSVDEIFRKGIFQKFRTADQKYFFL